MVVWLGTSVRVSRRSTFTGRSTTGIRNRSPGSRTIASLVLPSRKTTMRSYCCTIRTDRYRITNTTTRMNPSATSAAMSSMGSSGAQGRSAAGAADGGWDTVDASSRAGAGPVSSTSAVSPSKPTRRTGVSRGSVRLVGRPGGPRLAGEVHRSGGRQRRLDHAEAADRHPVATAGRPGLHAPCPDGDQGDQTHEHGQRGGRDDENGRRDLHHRVARRCRARVEGRGAQHDAHEPRDGQQAVADDLGLQDEQDERRRPRAAAPRRSAAGSRSR